MSDCDDNVHAGIFPRPCNEEIFVYFLEIMMQILENLGENLNKCFLITICIVMSVGSK